MKRLLNGKSLAIMLALAVLSGCASMASQKLSRGLANAMLNQDDPEIVRAGAPAYLLLIDTLIEDNAGDTDLLIAGAQLYGAYASGLIKDPERTKKLSQRARNYAERAFCSKHLDLCAIQKNPYEQFERAYSTALLNNSMLLYTYATAWAGWIQTHSEDWNAIADLPKVELLLEKLIKVEPEFENGRAQLYLAVMKSKLPANLGGKPELGRVHFEQAIRFSNGKDLIAKVEFARNYARLVFNQKLHDRLLQEVVKADPYQPNLTLSNILAQQEAAILLKDEYF